MQALKITQIGNSLGIILPKEILARLKVEKGDQLFLTEAPYGFRVNNADPVFEVQMKAAEEIMRKRRDALRELTK
jgi:putative addiction module antidote